MSTDARCICCNVELDCRDEDPNGDTNVECARCRAESEHDFDREPNVVFNRDGSMKATMTARSRIVIDGVELTLPDDKALVGYGWRALDRSGVNVICRDRDGWEEPVSLLSAIRFVAVGAMWWGVKAEQAEAGAAYESMGWDALFRKLLDAHEAREGSDEP